METRRANVTSQLAATKFVPPASQSREIVRTQVLAAMRESSQSALIFVHGPAGFGKTTAMTQYHEHLRAHGVATAWLTLDGGDNDLGRFLASFGVALRAICGDDCGHELARDVSGNPAAANHVALDAVGSLASCGTPFAFFLDDLERIDNPVVFDVLRQCLERLPRGGRFVIGSRALGDLGLGRLRVQGRLVEIGPERLSFSLDETRDFLRSSDPGALQDAAISELQQRTHGWPAALSLAALTLRDRPHPHELIAAFNGSSAELAQYLLEDVLARQDEATRAFLLRSSVLRELSPALCDHVLECSGSGATLARIERAHLFLAAADVSHDWYRYHPLFAGFLEHRLNQHAPTQATTLRRRAARWWLDRGQPARAIEYALQSGDAAYLLHLLKAQAGALMWRGRARTLARWWAALPPGVDLSRHPRLALVFASALAFTHHFAESERLLDALDAVRMIRRTAGWHTAVAVHRGALYAMSDRVREAAALWREYVPRVGAEQPYLYVIATSSMGYCLIAESRFAQAREFLRAAREVALRTGDSFVAPMALCLQGAADMAEGRLESALAAFRAAFADDSGQLSLEVFSNRKAVTAAFLAEALYERNDLDEAERLLRAYLPLLRDAAAPDQLIGAYAILARIALARSESARAEELLREMERVGHHTALPRMVASARLERGRAAALRGNGDLAREQVSSGGDPRVWSDFAGVVMYANDAEGPEIGAWRARILSGGAIRSSVASLRAAVRDAVRCGRQRRALKLRILLAEALLATGAPQDGMRQLHAALRQAAGETFLRTFLDEGPRLLGAIRTLRGTLADLPGDGAVLRFVDRLLNAAGIGAGAAGAALEEPPHATSTAAPLSRRELEVLGLVAQGLSNREIAVRLFVAETTVKTHLRKINSVLGAHSRTQALRIARQLRLMP